MDSVTLSLIPAFGMIIIATASVVFWRWLSAVQLRWFWIGAALWTVGVGLKLVFTLLTNQAVIGFLNGQLSYPYFLLSGGLFLGIQSSLCEIGVTLAAVLVWRKLGSDFNRAIGIGVGAGAFEALLLGLISLCTIMASLLGMGAAEQVRKGIEGLAATTPLFWLIAPVERLIAIPCHAASRSLVLLGAVMHRSWRVWDGFLLFALLDTVAGAAHVSGKLDQISMWWVELALVPFALVSVAILRSTYRTGLTPTASSEP